MSVFRRRKSNNKLRNGTEGTPRLPGALQKQAPEVAPPLGARRVASGPASPSAGSDSLPGYGKTPRIDDFGRVIPDRPAFALERGQDGEAELMYGYGPLGTNVELGVVQLEKIAAACAEQIRTRGLDTPLVLSTMALDLSVDEVNSICRAYVADPKSLSSLHLADPVSVAAFLKWALARFVNEAGGHGFVTWSAYEAFKEDEKAGGFLDTACSTDLLARLPPAHGRLLLVLLSLFSSVAAHSAKNGLPPRKLAGLFSPYVFGLRHDRSFDETYQEWQRCTLALEHILLAYLRFQATSALLPTFLQSFLAGYPDSLGLAQGSTSKTSTGARLEETTRVKRIVRFHSRDLIRQAGSWDVPDSTDWQLLLDPNARRRHIQPVFTSSYRHLLNIRSAHGLGDDDDEDLQRFGSTVQMEWAKFGETGFSEVDSTKLEFDLTESEREKARRKRDTLDWSTFESAGFAGRETFKPTDLGFRHQAEPASQRDVTQRLYETEKTLPPFPYDTTPREAGRLPIDVLFFEAWADALVASGWARDELKESNFALVHWRSRPRNLPTPTPDQGDRPDPRTEERWFLVEELVPRDYREALLVHPTIKKAHKGSSFLRSVRRRSGGHGKDAPLPALPGGGTTESRRNFSAPVSRSGAGTLKPIDEAVFSPNGTDTRLMSLSNLNVSAGAAEERPRPSTTTAPSVYTTPSVRESTSTARPAATEFGVSREVASTQPAIISTSATTAPAASKPGLPPAVGSAKGLDRKGLMARFGTARRVSGDKIGKFFATATKTEAPFSSSSKPQIGELTKDTKPGMPPLAPVAAPASAQPVPSPPPKGDDAASLAASAPGTPSLDDAAGVDGDENPYGGLSAPSEDEHAETLQAEEHPSEAKPRDSPPRAERTPSGVSTQTSRVANIIGLYEERDRKDGEDSKT